MMALKVLNAAMIYGFISSYGFKDLALQPNWKIYTVLLTFMLLALSFIPKASRKIFKQQGAFITFSQTIVFTVFILIRVTY